MAYIQEPPVAVAAAPIVLPARLPAECFLTAAADYVVPATILVAIVKVESQGKAVVRRNDNGTLDYGVAQINSASWGRYMAVRYGISAHAILNNACQAIRVMAYALRTEMNHQSCGGRDVWCGVGRYHAPNNASARAVYVPKVRSALAQLESTRRFE